MSKNVRIASEFGEIAAVIHYPVEKTERLAILCPGFLDSKDYMHVVKLAEMLCGEGYTVVRFDPTGTWESEGDISEYTITSYLENISAVLEYMLQEGDFRYVLLGGHSRGGQVSVLYASRDKRISLVLGIMASFGSLQGKPREEWKKAGIKMSYRDIPGSPQKTKEFAVPFSHVVDRDTYDALSDVRKVNVPIIFLAGERDTIVPVGEVEEFFQNAHEPKKFILLRGIGHDYRHSESEVVLVNKKIREALVKFC